MRIVVRRPRRTFFVIIRAMEEHNGSKSCLTGSRVEPWIENGAGFYRCNYFGSDERPRRYLRRGSNADGPNGRAGRHDLSRPTNRSCGTEYVVSARKLAAIARLFIRARI